MRFLNVKQILYSLFSYCFNHSMMPTTWLRGIISPIPKGADKDPYVPLNYRGVSLLSCVYKTYSSIINNRLVRYAEDLGILVDEQNGFRAKRACVDHVYSLSTLIRNRLTEGKDTYAAFVDMQKAFDWVDRDLLFYKLLCNNVNGKIYQAIKSLYNNTISCVRLNTELTPWFMSTSGVRQGDVLSPTLFALFVNDLAIDIKDMHLGVPMANEDVSILLYADDIVILAENEENLQCMISYMQMWCNQWRLKINYSKTNIMHFRNRRKSRTSFIFKYDGVPLEVVDSYKYLGIYFNEYLSFSKNANILAESSGRALGGIIGKFKNMKNLTYDIFLKLFQTGVIPIMDYCAGVWGFNDNNALDVIQNRAMRYFLGVNKFTPTHALYGDLGWFMPKYRRWIKIASLWNRFVSMEDGRLTKRIFLWDKELCCNNWASDLYEILSEFGLEYTFEDMATINIKEFEELMLQRTAKTWKDTIRFKPKLRTYVKFKSEFGKEEYLTGYMSRQQRSLLAQFRGGILPLHVETGRWQNIPWEERTCKLCNQNCVEDEFHFLCNCDLYIAHRNSLFDKVTGKNLEFATLSTEDKFLYLLKFENREVARYLERAYDMRKTCIYQ